MRNALVLAALAVGGDAVTLEEFEKIHAQLRPSLEEAWRKIPWKVSLVEAQNVAAREKKPVFIWAMDGNPLACG
jgi:hypothetical protein